MPPSVETIIDTIAPIVASTVADEAAHADRDAAWPERSIRALQQAGLMGLVVPEEHGGSGLGLDAVVRTSELIGTQCGSTALCVGMHHVATAVIAAKATPGQVERYLRPIAAGDHITTLALSEPGTGAHFYYPEALLHWEGDGWRVTGTKSFVTNGRYADSYVVSTTAADPAAPPAFFSCLVVDNDNPGLRWQAPYAGLGMRGNAASGVGLEDLRAPAEALLGEEGDQIWYVFNVIAPYFLVAMAGTYLGIAERALQEVQRHLKARGYHHDGSHLAQAPVLQHRLGGLWAQVQRTRRLVYWSADEAEMGGPQALPALCAAKAEVAHCAVDVCNEAMTIMGGEAYADNGVMARLLRDARAAHVMAPTTDILQTWAGRALLGLPLLEG